MNHWLFKTEPGELSIDDMKRQKVVAWTGIRNYQARNLLRDEVKKGDSVVIYHSSTGVPAAVGLAEVVAEAHTDEEQFDRESDYYDPKSKKENPQWVAVDVKYKKTFARPVTLAQMRTVPKLKDIRLLAKGNRLSILPLTKGHFDTIVAAAR